MMKRIILYISLFATLYSCGEEDVVFIFPELRFYNATEMKIDSAFFYINDGTQQFKIENLASKDTTDYYMFTTSDSPPRATLYIDSLIIESGCTDPNCCVVSGKYTIDIDIIIDDDEDRAKAFTTATEDE